MRRPLPVPVEPLPQQRWARIERGLFARLDAGAAHEPPPDLAATWFSGSRWVAAALAVAALLLAVGLAGFFGAKTGTGQTQASRITTGRDGSHLVLRGVTLDVDPESAVVVGEASDHGMLVVVDKGSLFFDVAPRPRLAPLIVQAGGVQVRVIGTRFRVERAGESARVAVEHGVVEVASGGLVARVKAGEVWPAAPPAGSVRAPEPAAVQSPSQVDVREDASGRTAPRVPLTTAQPEGPPQARFERAARLERRAPDEAIALYRGLEGGSDSWAANALFAHGRLEAARGNRSHAERLLSQYLRRFPKGANHHDARSILERLR
jgi:FecR protein